MTFQKFFLLFLTVLLLGSSGCAKQVDPKRPIEKIQKEVVSMPVAELESHAAAYAVALRARKAEIKKIQQEIQKLPMDKVFNNKAITSKIALIGRQAEALFERYRIYVKALQEKGGDLSKVQID